MQYFVSVDQRSGTCYHEFYKGKWDRQTFWRADSILLHDDLLFDEFADAIIAVVPAYDRYGATEISAAEWHEIGKAILTRDQRSQEVYREADRWLKKVFEAHTCFTILGI